MLRRLLELNAVGLEACRELVYTALDGYTAEVIAIAICSCYGVAQTQQRVVILGHTQTIHHDGYIVGSGVGIDRGQKLLDEDSLAINPQTGKTVAEQLQQAFDNALALL